MSKRFYITTPIYYVNSVPHIGTTLTTVIADICKRYMLMRGQDAFYLTGTDENGLKVMEAAVSSFATAIRLLSPRFQTFEPRSAQGMATSNFSPSIVVNEYLLLPSCGSKVASAFQFPAGSIPGTADTSKSEKT